MRVLLKGTDAVKSVLIMEYGMIRTYSRANESTTSAWIVHPIDTEFKYVCRLRDVSRKSLPGIREIQCTILFYERAADIVDVLWPVAVYERRAQEHHATTANRGDCEQSGINALLTMACKQVVLILVDLCAELENIAIVFGDVDDEAMRNGLPPSLTSRQAAIFR
jgi:hypothetical protein